MAEQIFGKLFTKEEADKEFGPVLASKEVKTSVLNDLLAKSEDVLMFKMVSDAPVILGNGRIPLYPDVAAKISGEEVFHMFSISVIKELIASGGKDITIIEQREKHLTVTNGATTMELAGDCPPYCK
jgi:hypothetical protein